MDVQKRNSYLFPVVKEVQLKSVKGELFTDFTKIYGTPSKIRTNIKSRLDKKGYTYNYTLELQYPGLKEIDFTHFDKMLRDRFEIKIQFCDNNWYSWSSKYFPFKMNTTYKKGTTIVFRSSSPIPANVTYSYGSPDYAINYYQ